MIESTLILASASPRRKFLLAQIKAEFSCLPLDIEEIILDPLDPIRSAENIARDKAEAARPYLGNGDIVITADTVVSLDGQIMGKPSDLNQAREFLVKLSGKVHWVVTGVCLLSKKKSRIFSVQTFVTMDNLQDQEIEYYLSHWNPVDKAGAYGIQDWIGWAKISRIEGSYSNVMGLPVCEVYRELLKF